jgi:uncharacterized protein (TIRG00374 family)
VLVGAGPGSAAGHFRVRHVHVESRFERGQSGGSGRRGALSVGLNYRMWRVAGIEPDDAGGAVAASTVVSLGTLFALPIVTVVAALVGAPAPKSLVSVAVGGAIVFVLLFGVGAVLLANDRASHALARFVERVARALRRPKVTARRIEDERQQLRTVLGSHWRGALTASTSMWALDYLSLVAVLVGLRTKPRLSVVLLAFTASKILAMVPVTPGGLGVVEASLTGMLTLAGIPARQALLATLAYRLASYWLSLPAGLIAWLAFRHRYPSVDASTETPARA